MKKILSVILTFAIVLSAVCVTFANDNVLDMSALIADTSAWQFTGTASNDGKKIGLSGAFETAGYAKTLQFETLEFKSTLVVPWGNWGRINFRQDNAMSVPWALQNTYSFEMQYSGITLYKWLNGSYEALGSTTYNIIGDDAAGTEHAVKITVKNNSDGSVNIVMAVDDEEVINATDSKNPITSHGQLSFQIGGNGRFDISGVKAAGGDTGDEDNATDMSALIANTSAWQFTGTASNDGKKIGLSGAFETAGYANTAEFETLKFKSTLVVPWGNWGRINFRQDNAMSVPWALQNTYSFEMQYSGITLYKWLNGSYEALGSTTYNIIGDDAAGTEHDVKITVKNNSDGSVNIVMTVDDEEVINATDSKNPITSHGQLSFQIGGNGRFDISGIKPAGGDPGDEDDDGNVMDIFTLIADDANWTLGGTATNNGEKINTPGPFDVAGYTKNAEFDTLKLKTKLIAEYGCFGLITVRTDSPAVGMWAINNGYSFQIMSTGITLIKFAATQQTALATSSVNLVGDTVHELKIKIKNNDDGSVNIVLNADGTEVINATDSTNPYTEHGQLGFQASAAGTFEISGTPYDIPETKLIDITLKDKATGNAVTEINNGMTVYADGEILQGVEGNVYLYTAVFDGERLVDCYFTSAKAEKGTVSSPNITLSFEQEQRNDYVIKVFALNAPYSKPICAPAIFPFAQ